jgi:hypothetical protein
MTIRRYPAIAALLVALVGMFSVQTSTRLEAAPVGSAEPRLRFVMDMVHHNPGEAKFQTKFLDPKLLKAWGFNGNIPREFVQSAVTYDSFDREIFPVGSTERAWVEDYAREIDVLFKAMKAEGQPCYPFTDFIVLPKRLVEKYREEICDSKGRIDISRPKTKEVLRAMIAEIFERFPSLGGLTVRHGETYLHDVPYHTGGNPILNGEASHIELINLLREEVCVKRNKLLFYRTWDFGNMHDRPEFYLGVTDNIEPHPNLFFSIKHQQGDYHRLSRFNPCLGIGKHPQIVEVQSQLEAYGKGAFPYYNGQGVIDGWEEYASHKGPKGLRDFLDNPLFAGVWTWSRGGGWKGPYIPNEFWIDLNTYVVARWAQNPTRTEEEVFNEFARDVAGIRNAADLARFRRLAILSASAVLRSQNSLISKLNVWWNRDEYFANITSDLKRVVSAGKTAAFLAEKAEATAQYREIESLSRQIKLPDARNAEFVRVSSTYGRIKAEIIEQMCRAILFNLEKPANSSATDSRVAAAIASYDKLWAEWRKLKADYPNSCPTLYTDRDFYDRPGMGAAIDKLRKR